MITRVRKGGTPAKQPRDTHESRCNSNNSVNQAPQNPSKEKKTTGPMSIPHMDMKGRLPYPTIPYPAQYKYAAQLYC
jgi:hypothetical protein